MNNRSAPRGFTLIELLTVIAIIAVLAAILFPVFGRARAKAHQTTCLANLQQLGSACAMYTDDSGGFVPTWCIVHNNPGSAPSDNTSAGFLTWDAVLMPYMKNSAIVKCMGNPTGNGRNARAYTIAHYTQKRIDGVLGGWGALRGIYRDEVPAPTRTILLYEKGAWPPTAWGDALGQNVFETTNHKTTEAPPGSGDSWNEDMFHFEGKNFLYLDSHAKFAPAGQYPFNHKPTRGGALTGDVWAAARIADGGDWPNRE